MSKIKNPIGIDISDLTLRFVQFKGFGHGTKLHAFNKIDVPAGYIDKGRIIEKEEVKKTLKQLFETSQSHKIIRKNLIVSLPEDKSFIKVFEIPFVERKQILTIIKKEAEKHIPLHFEELYYDWQIIQESKEENKILLLFGATPREIINEYHEIFQSLGFIPLVFEIESVALARAVIDQKKGNKISAIIVDIGFDRSTFIIFDDGIIQYATCVTDVSGNLMTELLASNLQIYPKRAEALKRKYGLNHKTEVALLPFFDQLRHRLNETVSFCQEHCTTRRQINQLILSGGASQTKNILNYLTKKFNFEVKQADPWVNLPHLKKQKKIPPDQILSFITAIGLALRSVLVKDYI